MSNDTIISTIVLAAGSGVYYRIMVRKDFTLAVFETDKHGASLRWNAILEQDAPGGSNSAKLSKVIREHGEIVRQYLTGARS